MGNNKKVWVDISRSEKLEFTPLLKNVFIVYSDPAEHQLLCYTLEEVLAEKLHAVLQRMQARDFYDIWYLLEVQNMDANFYVKEFIHKCTYKNFNTAEFHKKLAERLPQEQGRWQSSLNEQIQNLPNFYKVGKEVMRHLKKLKV